MNLLFLVLAASAPSIVPVDNRTSEGAAYADEVVDTLRLLRDPGHPSLDSLAPSFTQAGQNVPDLLFRCLVDRSVPASGEIAAQRLSVFQRDLIVLGFEGMGRGFVYHAIGDELMLADDVAERRATIEVLGAIGTADEIGRVFDLTLAPQEERPIRGLEDAFRVAVRSILSRDASAFVRLERTWRAEPPELYGALLRAVGESERSEALAFLADVILWNDDLAVPAMAQIPRIGLSDDPRLNEELRVRLRRYLHPSDPAHCQVACLALAELEDLESIPYLIDLLSLEETSSGVKKNAVWGLQQLSGLKFGQDARRWAHWYDSELEWMRREKAKEFRRIMSHDERQAAKGIREVSHHRLAREELILSLHSVLMDRNEDVRVLGCQALATYGDERAVSWLIHALEDPHPEVRRASWTSLRKLTGLELTPLEWAMRGFASGY